MLSTRDPPQNKGHIQTESEGQGKIFHANGDQKKAGEAILISDKIDFKVNVVNRDKEGHIRTESEGLEKRYSMQIETKRKQE